MGRLGAGRGHRPGWGPGAERAVGAAWANSVSPQHTDVFAQKDWNDPGLPSVPLPAPSLPCHLEEPLKGSVEVTGNSLSLAGILSAPSMAGLPREAGKAGHRTGWRAAVLWLHSPGHAPQRKGRICSLSADVEWAGCGPREARVVPKWGSFASHRRSRSVPRALEMGQGVPALRRAHQSCLHGSHQPPFASGSRTGRGRHCSPCPVLDLRWA